MASNILGFDQLGQDDRDLFGPEWAEQAQPMIGQFRAACDLRWLLPLPAIA